MNVPRLILILIQIVQATDYEINDSDKFRNYMAYTYNSCRDSFTPEQIATMQGRATSAFFK
jgi:hypothetical protein